MEQHFEDFGFGPAIIGIGLVLAFIYFVIKPEGQSYNPFEWDMSKWGDNIPTTNSGSGDSWQAGANVGRALFGSKMKKSCRSCGEIIPHHAGKCPHCHEETKYGRSLNDHFDSRLK